MVSFDRFTLANGLRVLVHQDNATPMAVVNILYDVGARDENPEQTGFAHLFEHLMFGGSANIPNFDGPSQAAGAQNNAFTSNDITNYYITLPAANIETAFWLESDRMLELAFNEKSLDVQRNVVCEEFKQRYLNQPYGDTWLRLRPMAYHVHPYRWATIGKELAHIEDARMEDVRKFFATYYTPANAYLVVAGNVETANVKELAEKWFGPIPGGGKPKRQLPPEPPQQEARREVVYADVPQHAIYIAFHSPARNDAGYYAVDLITDLLSQGPSSRLYRRLVKDNELFSEINAYQTGSIDPGLLVVEGKPLPNVPMDAAEKAIWEQLEQLCSELIASYELEKVKNKIESTMVFAEMAILEKAMNLAYFELLGDADGFNHETARYLAVTEADIQQHARQLFRKENSSTLIYLANEHAQ
ncbi:MAG TPA: pitrilysin family protein [Parapedobacter sp.]|uniref:M16 family metallopeptidase n=1 Tax=Parapedobacter sp. TaxID=1958893 RepID=UPI002CE77A54|nr:pitrilysin family protein [Parapedobacter sp.]HWK56328.1 pitrilysin family protein [Parapedobacter sp.]